LEDGQINREPEIGDKNLNSNDSKFDSDIKKLKTLKNVVKTIDWLEANHCNNKIDSETGGVCYALPCAALYDRTFKNEISRIEIEIYNKKFLDMYENPSAAYSQYEEEINAILNKLRN